MTNTVSTLSTPGQGGVWNFNNQNLTVGTATNSAFVINGATLTNIAYLSLAGAGAAIA